MSGINFDWHEGVAGPHGLKMTQAQIGEAEKSFQWIENAIDQGIKTQLQRCICCGAPASEVQHD